MINRYGNNHPSFSSEQEIGGFRWEASACFPPFRELRETCLQTIGTQALLLFGIQSEGCHCVSCCKRFSSIACQSCSLCILLSLSFIKTASCRACSMARRAFGRLDSFLKQTKIHNISVINTSDGFGSMWRTCFDRVNSPKDSAVHQRLYAEIRLE